MRTVIRDYGAKEHCGGEAKPEVQGWGEGDD